MPQVVTGIEGVCNDCTRRPCDGDGDDEGDDEGSDGFPDWATAVIVIGVLACICTLIVVLYRRSNKVKLKTGPISLAFERENKGNKGDK